MGAGHGERSRRRNPKSPAALCAKVRAGAASHLPTGQAEIKRQVCVGVVGQAGVSAGATLEGV